MTTSVEALEAELADAIKEREQALAALEQANARCKRIIAALLRAGCQRKRLIDRPYSAARLSQIQKELGLPALRSRRSQTKEAET